jgi:hypothetical protein
VTQICHGRAGSQTRPNAHSIFISRACLLRQTTAHSPAWPRPKSPQVRIQLFLPVNGTNGRSVDAAFDPDQDPEVKRELRQNYRALTRHIRGASRPYSPSWAFD